MVSLPIYQIDAFTRERFAGNPAAVCPLDAWLPAETMQAIAAENNLAETAFFVHRDGDVYDLRWFTPKVEIELCGHATLASAYVIFHELRQELESVRFESASGPLVVERDGDRIVLDFPARHPSPIPVDPGVGTALGRAPAQLLRSDRWVAVYDTEDEVRAVTPDMAALLEVRDTVVITAPGTDVDFVSRFFAPTKGVPEDPVTGSAHCSLIPYWAERTGKRQLRARQVSERGGELWCEYAGERVRMAGHAVCYLRGTIDI